MESPLLSNYEQLEQLVNLLTPEDCASLIYTLVSIPIALALNSIEFVFTLVKIIVALVIVNGTKGEYPEATWILVYTYGCIASLIILCWRFWQILNPISHLRVNRVMFLLRTIIEYFFVGWTLVFFWVFVYSSSPLDQTSKLFWLCVGFLAFGFIRYVLPIVICTVSCCCMCTAVCFYALKA